MGFEPTERSSRSAVFKTAAFNHSATSPSPRKSLWLLRFSRNRLSHEITTSRRFLTFSHDGPVAASVGSRESASLLTASLATPSMA